MTWHVVWVLLFEALLLFAVGGLFALVWLLPHRGFAGARPLGIVDVTGPRQGSNAGGDSFTTDGRAAVFLLPG